MMISVATSTAGETDEGEVAITMHHSGSHDNNSIAKPAVNHQHSAQPGAQPSAQSVAQPGSPIGSNSSIVYMD